MRRCVSLSCPQETKGALGRTGTKPAFVNTSCKRPQSNTQESYASEYDKSMRIHTNEPSTKPMGLPSSLAIVLGVAAACCLLLILFRAATTISFRTPLQFPTTGYEQEALFSLWKFGVGQPVYADGHQLPFA